MSATHSPWRWPPNRDKLHLGLHADPDAIPRLDQLGDAVTAALTELAHTSPS